MLTTWNVQFKNKFWLGVVAHAWNPNTQEADTGGSLWVPGQPELHSEFKTPWTTHSDLSQKQNQLNKQTKPKTSHCIGLDQEWSPKLPWAQKWGFRETNGPQELRLICHQEAWLGAGYWGVTCEGGSPLPLSSLVLQMWAPLLSFHPASLAEGLRLLKLWAKTKLSYLGHWALCLRNETSVKDTHSLTIFSLKEVNCTGG